MDNFANYRFLGKAFIFAGDITLELIVKYRLLCFSVRHYLAIHALSELISARIQEVEAVGKTSIVYFDSSKDDYSWINNNALLETACLDRYAIRAVLSLLFFHSKSAKLMIEENNGKLKIVYDSTVPETLLNDLNVIAFWGAIKLSFDKNLNIFEIENE